jgi:hypothetical protein
VLPASAGLQFVLFPATLLKVGKALGFVGLTTILRTKIKIETQPLFIMDASIFLKYSLPQGTPRNVPGLHQALVSYDVLHKLFILPFWMICRKADIRLQQIFSRIFYEILVNYQNFLS